MKYLLSIAIFLLTLSLSAQITPTSQWTWMKGDSSDYPMPIYGVQGVASISTTPSNQFGSITWTDAAGNFWLFGGSSSEGGYINSLWKYNTSTSQWTWVKGDSTFNERGRYGSLGVPTNTNNPGARNNGISWVDASGNLWLFGGFGLASSGRGYLNDLWKYNVSTNQWTWVNGDSNVGGYGIYGTLGVPSSSNRPGSRFQPSAWTDASGNFWLFGGLGYDGAASAGYLNDLWKYNPLTNQWTWIKGDNLINKYGIYGTQGIPNASNKPGSRYKSSMWIDNSGNFWLFGGAGYSSADYNVLNDLWKYSPTTNQWTWMSGSIYANALGDYGTQGVTSSANVPGARSPGSFWTDLSGNFWLFGGFGFSASGSSGQLNDVWKYNTSTNQWTWMKGDNTKNQVGVYGLLGITNSTNKPGSRTSMCWRDLSGNFWLYSGSGFSTTASNGFLTDLWKYDPLSNQWTWISGDKNYNNYLNYGSYGTKGIATNANNPGGRGASYSWKDGSGNFWVFGGLGLSNSSLYVYLNDLWKYDPTSNQWTWIKGDSSGSNTGVYGNLGISAVGNNPGARGWGASWLDGSGNFWLFGGDGHPGSGYSNGYLNDLWKYDPTSNQWTWIKGDSIYRKLGKYGSKGISSATNNPGARREGSYWTDASGNFWLFGGRGYGNSGSYGLLNDLWKYDPTSNQWTWMSGDSVVDRNGIYGTLGIANINNKPGSRWGSIQWIDDAGDLWLFGGAGYSASTGGDNFQLNDLWKYSISSNQWTWVKGDNSSNQSSIYGTQGVASNLNKPSGRMGSISWKDNFGNFWLYGGDLSTGQGYTNSSDLWKYNLLANQWTWVKGDTIINQSATYGTSGISSNTIKPGCRIDGVTWTNSSGSVWLFGGSNNLKPDIFFNDIWKLDPWGTCGSSFTWIGVTSTDWTVGSNWCGGVVPGANDDAIVPGGTLFSAIVPDGVTTSVRSLTISTGAVVTVGVNAHLNVMH